MSLNDIGISKGAIPKQNVKNVNGQNSNRNQNQTPNPNQSQNRSQNQNQNQNRNSVQSSGTNSAELPKQATVKELSKPLTVKEPPPIDDINEDKLKRRPFHIYSSNFE